MSGQTRSLPDRPNLRYLKIEAKRRLRTGEFPTLHEAQLAIAREHGQPSWSALKRLIESRPGQHAHEQLQWIASRFADADASGWVSPADHELREHFEKFLSAVLPAGRLLPMLTALAPRLFENPSLSEDTPTHVLVQIEAGQLQVVVGPAAPYRIVGLRAYGTGKVSDPRPARPVTQTTGDVPATALDAADRACSELGLAGLALAGGGSADTIWALARGWACLDPAERLTIRHRFPAWSVTELITATAVLRLVAEDRVALDTPVNRQLDTVALADPAVTVRELLSHTCGVDGPAEPLADVVPDTVALFGPVLPCGGARGRYARSDGGYAVLGLLVADVTRSSYAEAVTRLVLEPLRMADSSFPAEWPHAEPDTVTGYVSTSEGTLEPAPSQVCTVPAAGGLWTTAPDLVRFGHGWHTLLPSELVSEALTPQAELPGGSHIGLGWHLARTGDIAGRPGSLPGASASLVVHLRDRRVHAALTNRDVPVEPVNGRILRALS